jgi:predicted Na+-dependent transporter
LGGGDEIGAIVSAFFLGFFYFLGLFVGTGLFLLLPGLLMAIIGFKNYIICSNKINKYEVEAIMGLYSITNSLLSVALGLVLFFTSQVLVIIPMAIFGLIALVTGIIFTVIGFVKYYKKKKNITLLFENEESNIYLSMSVKL